VKGDRPAPIPVRPDSDASDDFLCGEPGCELETAFRVSYDRPSRLVHGQAEPACTAFWFECPVGHWSVLKVAL
jgi:hypothetical protein